MLGGVSRGVPGRAGSRTARRLASSRRRLAAETDPTAVPAPAAQVAAIPAAWPIMLAVVITLADERASWSAEKHRPATRRFSRPAGDEGLQGHLVGRDVPLLPGDLVHPLVGGWVHAVQVEDAQGDAVLERPPARTSSTLSTYSPTARPSRIPMRGER